MQTIYMDHNATTPLDPRVLDAMMPYLREEFANPSCRSGVAAGYGIQKARLQVAKLIGAKDSEIIFTSGGTESDNLALRSSIRTMGRRQIVTTAVEHPAVLETCRDLERYDGVTTTVVPVDGEGRVDPDAVYRALTARTAIVSVMTANNEIGTIQPVREIGRLLRKEDVLFHTDAVQAGGRIPIRVEDLGVDLLSLSAHKMFGPKGVGALYIREGTPFRPLQTGGPQEINRRAGTQNVAGIVGFGAAAELARREMESRAARANSLAARLWDRLAAEIPNLLRNSPAHGCLPGVLNVSIPGVPAQDMVRELDRAGICVSSGSACSEGLPGPSYVILAITRDRDRALSSIRFSLGPGNNEDEVDRVANVLPKLVKLLPGRR